jgi:hypothetical protein
MSVMRTGVLLCLLCSGLAAVCVAAQQDTLGSRAPGWIAGTVEDYWSGEPLIGAAVLLEGTEVYAATDLNGSFLMGPVRAGSYTVTGKYTRYRDDRHESTSVFPGCTTRVRMRLRLSPAEESLRRVVKRPRRPVPRGGSEASQRVRTRLPARSESRFHKSWGCIARSGGLLAIEQVGDSVLIQVFGGGLPAQPNEYQAGMREGRIAISEFRTFWDSLAHLGFWTLKETYSAKREWTGEVQGSISVSSRDRDGAKTSKAVRYSVPQSCSLEFRRVYSLFESMARFAQSVPDWKTLLRYDSAPPITEFKDRYHSAVPRAIAAVRDSQDLDTLLTMLLADDEYSGAVIGALGNIGSKRAVPALEVYIARLEAEPAPSRRYNLIGDAAKALFAVDGSHSAPTIRRLLRPSYPPRLVYALSVLLAGVGDYSGVPAVVEILSGPSRREVTWAADALKQIGHASQMAISALLQVAESEMKADKPDDRIIKHLYMTLAKLTGQEFIYRPEDPLSVRRSSMSKWLKWWQANAKDFPPGNGSGPGGGYGFIQVNSTPSDAAISLDTTNVGKTTPFLLLNVPVGKHYLRLTKERYADWSTSVTVTPGRTTTVDAALAKAFGSLLVTSSPSGTAISLDSTNTGTTPRQFAKVATGEHSLRLTRSGYPGWDSTVTVTQGQTTNVRAVLKSPPDSLWITYANWHAEYWVINAGPERAVRFNARSGFGYPLRIVKVSAVFSLHKIFPWPDSSFRFKIYGSDGQTLLYESPVLEAIPGEPGEAVVHELSAPVLVDSGEFYVSVAPIDSSGRPSSFADSPYRRADRPPRTDGRSYTGSPGHWSPLVKSELLIDVLLRR